MKRIALVLSSCMLLVPAVQAASFDCVHARSRTEQIVCANADLSKLDETLAEAYLAAQNDTSPTERRELVTAQRGWLKNVRDACDSAACLESAYKSRITHLTTVSMPASAQESGDAPYRQTDILANHPAPIGKGFPTILRPIDGDLVYSHYDDNGNTRSIVQFDFTNGHWANLVSGMADPTLIAQDRRYVVFHTPHSASFPIEVISRKTGARLGGIRLAKPVQGAFIQGDRLVLFQGQTRPYGFQQSIAILELPSLKLVREATLPGFYLVGIRGDHVYTAYSANGQRDMMVFDRQLNQLGRIAIPAPLQKLNMNCQPSIEEDGADRGVLVANCGEMHIVDLKSFSILHSIPRYALFYSMALHDRLIFTAAADQSTGAEDGPSVQGGIVVFDMDTGKQVAHFPIAALTIAIKENVLLTTGKPVWTPKAASWPMETYLISTAAIRRGEWQMARVVQQCRKAEAKLAATKDLYGAIGMCKDAGIEAYAEGASIPQAILPALRQYGFWLSQTLDRGNDAARVLEKVQAANPAPAVTLALNEARLKAKIIGSETPLTLTEAERQTDFGQVLETGDQVTKAVTKTIEFGAFSNLFYFSGDRLYVGRYGCHTTSCEGGATIGVFDRATLDELGSVEIAPDDEEYQDNIESLVADKGHIYTSVGYRYEQAGRPNFFVIDSKTLKITRRGQAPSAGTLRFDAEKLLLCGCHFTERQQCAIVDPATLNLTTAPDKTCVQNEPDNNTVVTLNGDDANKSFVAVTRDYLVAHNDFATGSYVLYPRAGGNSLPVAQEVGKALEWPATVEGNDIVIRQTTMGQAPGQLLKLVSLPSGTVQPLIGLPTSSSRFPVPMLHDHILYIGYGRDLLIYDLENRRLRRYIKDFIQMGFKDNGFGLDANRIDRLIVDQGRLIALTFYGANSRIVPLSGLLEK